MQLQALEPPLKIFYTFVFNNFPSCCLKLGCQRLHNEHKYFALFELWIDLLAFFRRDYFLLQFLRMAVVNVTI